VVEGLMGVWFLVWNSGYQAPTHIASHTKAPQTKKQIGGGDERLLRRDRKQEGLSGEKKRSLEWADM